MLLYLCMYIGVLRCRFGPVETKKRLVFVAKCYLCLEFNCLYIVTKDVGGCNITPVRECRSAILVQEGADWLVSQAGVFDEWSLKNSR